MNTIKLQSPELYQLAAALLEKSGRRLARPIKWRLESGTATINPRAGTALAKLISEGGAK